MLRSPYTQLHSRQKLKSYQPMMRSLLHSVLAFSLKRETQAWRSCRVTKYLRFTDSFKFIAWSLDNLVQSLIDTRFSLLDNFYRGYTDEKQKLLMKKVNCSNSYVDPYSKLSNLSLPSLKNWKNSLKDNQIDVNIEEFIHLNKVFKFFKSGNLKQFLKLYLTWDVLQLAWCFEEVRTVCYYTYGLDCTQF